MKYISDIMFWISNGLLIPVIVGLIFLFIKSLLIMGGMYAAYQSRRKLEKEIYPIFSSMNGTDIDTLKEFLATKKHKGAFSAALEQLISSTAAARDYLIGEYQVEAEKKMSSIVMVAKFGPTLGLMGTLIPMGPALVGLSSGDISTMAYNMQVAFATTVIGLFAGAVGYAAKRLAVSRMQKDMNRLSYVADIMDNREKGGRP